MSRTNAVDALNQAREQKMKDKILVATSVTVQSFDPSTMTVDVQPLVQQNGSQLSPIMGVPVITLSGGGFVCRPWFNSGEIGTIVYLNQDNDSAMATGKAGKANTSRSHSPTDAVFIGSVSKAFVGNYPANAFIISSENGDNYIAITEEGIEVKGNLNVDGNISATGSIE